MHLRTLVLALAFGAALGGSAGRGSAAPVVRDAAAGATIESATRTADPFLDAAGPFLELSAAKRSSGPLQLHRSPRPRLLPVTSSTLPVPGLSAAPVPIQSWAERGRREHHLGTPPPATAA